MKYLKKYNESTESIKDLASDIEDILLEFTDDNLIASVTIINTFPGEPGEIQIYITHVSDHYRTDNMEGFYLDDDKKNALIRIIKMCKCEYRAYVGHPVKQIYIYDDNRGIRSGGVKISDKYPMSYIQINLTNII